MNKLHKNFLVMIATGAVLAGCPADDAGTTDSDTDPTSTTAPTTTSTTMTTMSTSDTTSTTDPTTSSTTTDPTTGTDTATGSTGPAIPPPPTLGTQLDRIGRPAISTAAVDRFEGTMNPDHDDSVDTYNADTDPSTWATTHSPTISGSLAIYDSLDNTAGNQTLYDPMGNCTDNATCYGTLGTLVANDWLVVNSAGTDAAGYLGVEVEVADGAAMNTAIGGRTLTDDVIDASYTLLSGSGNLGTPVIVGDNVDAPDVAPSDTFPYLGAAN